MRLKYRIANKLGYDLIRRDKNHGDLAAHLPKVLARYGVDCVLDVGANVGQYGRLLRESGFSGPILSFEPAPEAFAELSAQARNDPGWTCFPVALGRREGRSTLNVSRSSKLSSFRAASPTGRERLHARIETVRREEVVVRCLDDLVAEQTVPREARILLKMDTQGYDLEVFEGARTLLDSVVVLQSELAVERLYEGMPDYVEAIAVYRRAGFEVTGLFPIYRDGHSLILGELDCVMARREPPAC